jgi:hypothetical protein
MDRENRYETIDTFVRRCRLAIARGGICRGRTTGSPAAGEQRSPSSNTGISGFTIWRSAKRAAWLLPPDLSAAER